MKSTRHVPGPGAYPNPDGFVDKFSMKVKERSRANRQSMALPMKTIEPTGGSGLSHYDYSYTMNSTKRNPQNQKFLESQARPNLPNDKVRFPGPG